MFWDRDWLAYFDWWVTYVMIMAGVTVGVVIYAAVKKVFKK